MPAFPPIVGSSPKIVILGSMPSVKSLQAQQYYAHPRNAFWPIMSSLFNVAGDYACRAAQLTNNRVAVWDVLYSCERDGSLDSNIVAASEQVNDFKLFFSKHRSVTLVGFNGLSARKIFNRHCRFVYDLFPDIAWVDLPSSSPAYAAMSVQQKCQIWGDRLALKESELGK